MGVVGAHLVVEEDLDEVDTVLLEAGIEVAFGDEAEVVLHRTEGRHNCQLRGRAAREQPVAQKLGQNCYRRLKPGVQDICINTWVLDLKSKFID